SRRRCRNSPARPPTGWKPPRLPRRTRCHPCARLQDRHAWPGNWRWRSRRVPAAAGSAQPARRWPPAASPHRQARMPRRRSAAGPTTMRASRVENSCSGLLAHQVAILQLKLPGRLDVIRVDDDAFHRANDHALRLVVVAHALRAQRRVDHVELLAQRDGLVRARRFADVAIDAGIEDFQGHGSILHAGCGPPKMPCTGIPDGHAACASDAGRAWRGQSPHISTKRNVAPVGFKASWTRCSSALSPMNTTITSLNEPGLAFLKASTTKSPVEVELGPPNASRLPGNTPRATVSCTPCNCRAFWACSWACWSSPFLLQALRPRQVLSATTAMRMYLRMVITFGFVLLVGMDERLLPALAHGLLHGRMHEAGDVPAKASDLAHQRRRDETVFFGRRQEQRLGLRNQMPVHAGQLELVLEIRHGAQPPNDHARANLLDEGGQQAVEAA